MKKTILTALVISTMTFSSLSHARADAESLFLTSWTASGISLIVGSLPGMLIFGISATVVAFGAEKYTEAAVQLSSDVEDAQITGNKSALLKEVIRNMRAEHPELSEQDALDTIKADTAFIAE